MGFWRAVFGSLLRTLLCFLIAFVSALIMAALGGLFPPLHKLLAPVVSFLRSVPTMAVILLIMLWMNYQNAPLFIGFLIAFPLLYSAFYTAITGVDRDLLEMAKLYKVSAKNRILRVYIPEIAPSVFDVSGSTVSLTLKVVIAAEVLCYTKNSIGINMIRANQAADIAYLLAWTLLTVFLSFLLELVFSALKRAAGVTK
jgi:ABC-type nitrate/sulfonate/bicarbonate transport system, permease component